jgi:hypothetical protein
LRQANGRLLFFMELLRGMQEGDSLLWDDEPRWVNTPTLGWSNLLLALTGYASPAMSPAPA